MNRCDLCGSPTGIKILELPNTATLAGTIYRCPLCGLEWKAPLPNAEGLNRIYNARYHEDIFFTPEPRAAANQDAGQVVDSLLHKLAARYEPPDRGYRLLDVGPGLGTLMLEARSKGLEVLGLEPCRRLAARLVDQGLSVIPEPIDTVALPEAAFDIIVMSEVLEHVTSPREVLQKASRFLAKNGLLYLKVPTNDCLIVRVARLLHRLGKQPFFSKPLLTHYGGYHTYFFTPQTLHRYLFDACFSIIEHRFTQYQAGNPRLSGFTERFGAAILGKLDRLRSHGFYLSLLAVRNE